MCRRGRLPRDFEPSCGAPLTNRKKEDDEEMNKRTGGGGEKEL
jgi:hypothetical protein